MEGAPASPSGEIQVSWHISTSYGEKTKQNNKVMRMTFRGTGCSNTGFVLDCCDNETTELYRNYSTVSERMQLT